MQVRIFESPDMTSGLKMIKKELGPDALILSTRTVRNGKMGLLGKPMLEITAAIDPDYPAQSAKKMPPAKKSDSPRPRATNTGVNHVVDDRVDAYLHPGSRSLEDTSAAVPSPPEPSNSSQQELQSEVDELKGLVASLAGQIHQLAPPGHVAGQKCHRPGDAGAATHVPAESQPARDEKLFAHLTARGVNEDTSKKIDTVLRQKFPGELINTENGPGLLQDTLQQFIQTSPPDFASGLGQHRIALIGPTGVGKTTTLAKIAADYLSNFSGSIALITIDTYRIAAVEQLKVYGEIMHLPVEVVINPAQLQEALGKHNDKDLILIDTAGRSPRDNFCIEELGSFLRPEFGIEKHLVVSATTRENELIEITNRFSRLIVDKTIFTKIDECINLGILLNLQMHGSAPLSYITNGQRVPEDLLQVDPQIVAELIMTHDQGPMYE